MEDVKEEMVEIHIKGMVGDYVSSAKEQMALRARQKAEGHIHDVSSRISDAKKLEALTALYVANTNTPTILGWKRYCLIHGSETLEELKRAWREGGHSVEALA